MGSLQKYEATRQPRAKHTTLYVKNIVILIRVTNIQHNRTHKTHRTHLFLEIKPSNTRHTGSEKNYQVRVKRRNKREGRVPVPEQLSVQVHTWYVEYYLDTTTAVLIVLILTIPAGTLWYCCIARPPKSKSPAAAAAAAAAAAPGIPSKRERGQRETVSCGLPEGETALRPMSGCWTMAYVRARQGG